MIVKNESKIIERCLDSVKGVVDCISICDTGSTDNTKEIIEQFLKKNQIPGKVHEHKWQNFGHNRTLSAQAAQQTLTELHFPLPDTYLLLLDADMLLEIEPGFNKDDLSADMYYVLQKYYWISSHYNTRLIRASKPWECRGVTHEYWACKESNNMGKLETLWIDDHDDGGCKSDKFERDIKLLTEGLKSEPNNDRYMFYLAQSYMCIDQHDEAIRWYKTRIQKGGWPEEVWYSKMMIGDIYDKKDFWDNALHWYLDAYDYRPSRAEPLQKIATHYRLKSQNELAYLFAKQGSRIPFPKDDSLFISNDVYDYKFDEELSIAAYYTQNKEEGLEAADRLILKKGVPEVTQEQAHKNLLFYVNNLPHQSLKLVEFKRPPLYEGSTEFYNASSPSIQKRDNGYDVICRTHNYTQDKGNNYHSRDKNDETVRTRNFLLRYDRDFKLLSQQEIVENLPRKKLNAEFRITGLEDCRLIGLDLNSWFVAATFDTHPQQIGQSLCKMKESKEGLFVEQIIPLKTPSLSNRTEKNWLPFVKEGKLYAIYGYNPVTIYQLDPLTGICKPYIEYEASHDFSRFRGSSGPIPFDDGYLVMVHEVIFNSNRHYLHRFLYLNKDFKIEKLSTPFTFLHKGIEYCCGITIDHDQKNCIIPIGYEDEKAYLLFVDLNTIRSSLKPLP